MSDRRQLELNEEQEWLEYELNKLNLRLKALKSLNKPEYFDSLNFIVGLMLEIDGGLKGNNLTKEIRHDKLKLNIKYGTYYD